jgi:hypothetical protein
VSSFRARRRPSARNAVGHTGVGVGASRFGARVALDLLDAGPARALLRQLKRYRPGGWRTVKPSSERGAVCQRVPNGPSRKLVSKRTPATNMKTWPSLA